MMPSTSIIIINNDNVDDHENNSNNNRRKRRRPGRRHGHFLSKYLRLAVALNLIPVGRDCDGRLTYRLLAATTVRSYLVWFLLLQWASFSAVAYMWGGKQDGLLWTALLDWMDVSFLATSLDMISFGLTYCCFMILAVFLPSILAGLLVTLQDVIPLHRFSAAWRPWLPGLAAALIPTFMGLEIVYSLMPWWQTFVTAGIAPPLAAIGLFAWMLCPSLVLFFNLLVMMIAADLVVVHTMTHLSRKFTAMPALSESYSAADLAAKVAHQLAEYQLIRRSLEPLLFLLVSSSTLFLVMDLFYATEVSRDHIIRSLIYSHLLVINTAILYHVSVAAEDCYNEFRSVLSLLRYGGNSQYKYYYIFSLLFAVHEFY